jgi:hypothetical protein
MSDFTELDAGLEELAAAAMGQPQRESLAVRFFIEPMVNEQKSREAGRDIFEDTEMVEIRVPGDRDVIRRPASTEDKKRFASQYVAFRKSESQEAAEGFPLKEWASISRSQALELAQFGIRTVEHLAGAPDAHLQQIGPLMALRQKARDWLAAAKDNAVLSKLRAENDDLKNRLAALENMLQTQSKDIEAARSNGGTLPAVAPPDPRFAALEAQLVALAAAVQQKPEPKKRGRPPKAAAEDSST